MLAFQLKTKQFVLTVLPTEGGKIASFIKVVDKKDLMIGLKGGSETLKEKFLSNMSQRAAEAFLEELGYLGAVRVKEVEEAQRKVVEAVHKLAETGVIQLGGNDEMIE